MAERTVMDKLAPHLQNGRFIVELDGKIRLQKKMGVTDMPWIFIRGRELGDCYLLKDVIFDVFGIIPSFCQYNCWKIVIRPESVKELFELYELLRYLNYPSKCGVEIRPYVRGSYGGYIYNNSQEEAEKRMGVLEDFLSKETRYYIKRSCTEFEMLAPNSREWKVSPEQNVIEQKIFNIFQSEPVPPYQPQWVINHVKRTWIYHAYKIGDDTYKQLIPEQDWNLFIEPVIYQEGGKYGTSITEDQQEGDSGRTE